MKRTCEACPRKITAKSPLAKYCSSPECKRARARGRKRAERTGNVVEFKKPPPADVAHASVEAATRAELELAKKVSSTTGQAALVLARQLDAETGDTGSSKAAVARQLQALMVEAMKGVRVADDPVDELKAARERRLRGA